MNGLLDEKELWEAEVKYQIISPGFAVRVRELLVDYNERDNQPTTKAQLIALRDALLTWKDKDAAAAVDNVIDLLSKHDSYTSTSKWHKEWYEKEDYGTRFIVSGGEMLEI